MCDAVFDTKPCGFEKNEKKFFFRTFTVAWNKQCIAS